MAVSLTTGGLSGLGIGEDQDKFNFRPGRNRYDADYSTEIASGDFDGDRRTDIFVANGTAWWYSRAGVKQWEFLNQSTARTSELAFADIDNDGRTDVLARDGAGRLGCHKSGTASLIPLTTLPVPISDLRFGDFDGDRRRASSATGSARPPRTCRPSPASPRRCAGAPRTASPSCSATRSP